MDHFCLEDESLYQSYEKGVMHRNFMGYTPNYTRCSIALGASGISDCWDMYVQNEKGIEAYQEIVNNGQLPIIKGHRLTAEEKIMRMHILNLMCKDYTYWSVFSLDHQIVFPKLLGLESLKIDGLVEYTSNSITVTEKGKYFIRNICAVIDPLFQSQEQHQNMFSKAI
jgi:oxygen-independent coproporphyrinogen-3 oxidase